MEQKIGIAAVIAHSDHESTGSAVTLVIADAINQATEEINFYARHRYSATALAGSTLITRWATTLACYFLMQNRGNPEPFSLSNEFDRIMKNLAMVGKGSQRLPDVAFENDMRPTMSNRRIDRRYKTDTVRVTRQNSTDAPTKLTQDRAEIYPSSLDKV